MSGEPSPRGSAPRSRLSLYALDRPALKAFSAELKALLLADDRPGLAALLGLGADLAARLASGPRAVDWFLRPESAAGQVGGHPQTPDASPIFASLRRVSKKRALDLSWTSGEPSLEGRLRHFDVIREDVELASLVDKLLDPQRLPWFLVRPGATGGWLPDAQRQILARELRTLKPSLTPELAAFADAIGEVEGDVVAHDAL